VSEQPAAVFRKGSRSAPDGYFQWEAAGLAWLADAPGGVAVVRVLDVAEQHLDLEKLSFANPDPAMAEAFGAALARTHDAGAPAFGSPPEGWVGDGFLGPATQLLPLGLHPEESWGAFYAGQRILPMLAIAVDSPGASLDLSFGLPSCGANDRQAPCAGRWRRHIQPPGVAAWKNRPESCHTANGGQWRP